MKKLPYLILIFFIASCSTNLLFDNELTSDQKVYVMSILYCDSGSNEDFNHGSLKSFFDGEGVEFGLRYGDGTHFIYILRKYDVAGNEYFLAEFKSKTFPFTKCRKLKSEPKYF